MTLEHAFVRIGQAMLVLLVVATFSDLGVLGLPDAAIGGFTWGVRGSSTAFVAAALIVQWRALLDHLLAAPVHLPLFAWFLATAAVGIDPRLGLFRWALAVQLLLLAACLVVSIGSPGRFLRTLFTGLAVITVVNAGLYLVNPSLGVDERGGFAGIIGDKNIAGQFYSLALAVALYQGLSVAGAGQRVSAAMVAVLAAVFLVLTKSKTSIAFGMGTIVVATAYYTLVAPHAVARLSARLGLAVAAGLALVLAGIGAVRFQDVIGLVEDPTFSGRTTIWSASLRVIGERPWTGMGFGSFWQGPSGPENPLASHALLHESERWITNARVINQSHNGFIDLALTTGLVGLALVLVAFAFVLGRLSSRIGELRIGPTRGALMAIHCGLWILLLNNLMESTLFYSPFYAGGVMILLLYVAALEWTAPTRRVVGSGAVPMFPAAVAGGAATVGGGR